jgi:hypothetical protein
MQSTANLFRLLNEFIMLLLGALLVLLAASHRIAMPERRGLWFALGAALILWGLRAGMRPSPKSKSKPPSNTIAKSAPEHAAIRGGSLILVGIMIVAIPLSPLHYEPLLLALAGGVLVLRGLLGSVLLVRSPG